MLEALIKSGADVNRENSLHETPLHLATARGHVDAVKLLLRSGAMVDCRTRAFETPLLLSARAGSVAVARELLAAGADLDAKDWSGMSPRSFATACEDVALKTAILHADDVAACPMGSGRAILRRVEPRYVENIQAGFARQARLRDQATGRQYPKDAVANTKPLRQADIEEERLEADLARLSAPVITWGPLELGQFILRVISEAVDSALADRQSGGTLVGSASPVATAGQRTFAGGTSSASGLLGSRKQAPGLASLHGSASVVDGPLRASRLLCIPGEVVSATLSRPPRSVAEAASTQDLREALPELYEAVNGRRGEPRAIGSVPEWERRAWGTSDVASLPQGTTHSGSGSGPGSVAAGGATIARPSATSATSPADLTPLEQLIRDTHAADGDIANPTVVLNASLDRQSRPLSLWSTAEPVPDHEASLTADAVTALMQEIGLTGRAAALVTRHARPIAALSWLLARAGLPAEHRRIVCPKLLERCAADGSRAMAAKAKALPVIVVKDVEAGGGGTSLRVAGEVRSQEGDALSVVRVRLETGMASDDEGDDDADVKEGGDGAESVAVVSRGPSGAGEAARPLPDSALAGTAASRGALVADLTSAIGRGLNESVTHARAPSPGRRSASPGSDSPRGGDTGPSRSVSRRSLLRSPSRRGEGAFGLVEAGAPAGGEDSRRPHRSGPRRALNAHIGGGEVDAAAGAPVAVAGQGAAEAGAVAQGARRRSMGSSVVASLGAGEDGDGSAASLSVADDAPGVHGSAAAAGGEGQDTSPDVLRPLQVRKGRGDRSNVVSGHGWAAGKAARSSRAARGRAVAAGSAEQTRRGVRRGSAALASTQPSNFVFVSCSTNRPVPFAVEAYTDVFSAGFAVVVTGAGADAMVETLGNHDRDSSTSISASETGLGKPLRSHAGGLGSDKIFAACQ